jgi:hypothetical protein
MSFDLKLSNGDLKLVAGAPVLVRNKDKLIQDILKILFTATGENKTHPWYGTPLLARAIATATDHGLLDIEVKNSVQYALSNLKTLQELQEKDNQFLTAQEVLSKIGRIDVMLDEFDKRKLIVVIEVAARSNDLISESFIVKL